MTPSEKKQTAFRLEPDILEGLHAIKDRDGVPISEQVRRALREWIDTKAVRGKTERQRAGTRKRP